MSHEKDELDVGACPKYIWLKDTTIGRSTAVEI